MSLILTLVNRVLARQMNQRCGSSPITVRRLVSFCMLMVCTSAPSALVTPNDAAGLELRHFYAVSNTFWDNGPAWDYRILEAREEGSDTLVRDILIISTQSPCGASCTVKARIKHLHNTNPADLVGENNPCAVDLRELRHEQRRAQRVLKHTPVFSYAKFTIVADCGGVESALQLPFLSFPSGPHGPPRVAQLYDLLNNVERRVFGTEHVFATSSDVKIFSDLEGEKEFDDDERAGAALVPELKSGAFDKALREGCKGPECTSFGFKKVLETYVPPDQRTEPSVSWVSRPNYGFVKVALPKYPPLAKLARIDGDVELELQVDEQTGLITGVVATRGHPLLTRAAIDAARGWQFQLVQHPDAVKKCDVVLRFEMKCNQSREPLANR